MIKAHSRVRHPRNQKASNDAPVEKMRPKAPRSRLFIPQARHFLFVSAHNWGILLFFSLPCQLVIGGSVG
jgi:hypothetical protein